MLFFNNVIPAKLVPAQAGNGIQSYPSFLRKQESSPIRHSCGSRNPVYWQIFSFLSLDSRFRGNDKKECE
jgi:hypothetical protein